MCMGVLPHLMHDPTRVVPSLCHCLGPLAHGLSEIAMANQPGNEVVRSPREIAVFVSLSLLISMMFFTPFNLIIVEWCLVLCHAESAKCLTAKSC